MGQDNAGWPICHPDRLALRASEVVFDGLSQNSLAKPPSPHSVLSVIACVPYHPYGSVCEPFPTTGVRVKVPWGQLGMEWAQISWMQDRHGQSGTDRSDGEDRRFV